MDRRQLFKALAITGIGVTAAGGAYAASRAMSSTGDVISGTPPPPTTSPSATDPPRLWPGHQPGRIYLGWSDGGDLAGTLATTGPVALRRSYFKWTNPQAEDERISEDHRAGRLPWISFKPPDHSDAWAAIADGAYDSDIRARARRYSALTAPVIVTFHHEPHNDGRFGRPRDFAAAWVRIHDLLAADDGLRQCAYAPVLGEYSFTSSYSRGRNQEAEDFLPPEVLDRMAFLGVDLYQNSGGEGFKERLGAIIEWLDDGGHADKQVGIGETGASDIYRPPTAAEWWSQSWAWSVENVDRVGAIAYWNSSRNEDSANLLLTETPEKLAAFKASLVDPLTVQQLET